MRLHELIEVPFIKHMSLRIMGSYCFINSSTRNREKMNLITRTLLLICVTLFSQAAIADKRTKCENKKHSEYKLDVVCDERDDIQHLKLSRNGQKLASYDVSYEKGENETLTPRYSFDYNWNDSLFSGVMYKQSETNRKIDFSSSPNFNAGRQSDYIKTKDFNFTVLGFQKEVNGVRYALAGEVQVFEIEKIQFGYASNASDNSLFAYENIVNIEVIKPGLRLDLGLEDKTNPLLLRTRLFVYPASKLSVDHYLGVQPSVLDPGTSQSSINQDISWQADLSFATNFSFPINLGGKARYQTQPLKYQMVIENADATAYDTISVKEESEISEWQLMLLFGSPDSDMTYLALGFGKRNVTNKFQGQSTTTSEKISVASLVKMF